MPDGIKGLLLTALLLLSGSLRADPLQTLFGHWQLTCTNLNACVVRSVPGDRGLVMTLSRQAGIHDAPTLRLDYGSAFTGPLRGEALADTLLLDGRRLQIDLKHWQVQPHHLHTHHAIAISEFLAQMMAADSLQMTWQPEAAFRLDGLAAALAELDRQQGRAGSLSAWVSRGPRGATALAPMPRAPEVWQVRNAAPPLSPQERRGLIDFGSWRVNTDGCSLDPLSRAVTIAPLTAAKALLLVSCEKGAYNTVSLGWEVSRRPPYVARDISLRLPFTPPGHGDRHLELINAGYDAVSSQLSTAASGRGLGDCGWRARWQFNGKTFVLADYAAQSACDSWQGSRDWPPLWQTRAVSD
ncbi:DUF1176 domain-containing protein [Pantoea sp. 1.19]|uniref:DUF1176 domain-containing protein n=1 Tax=Pantoea sp. 1.19 TaxID=1925589 RepID=UPI0009491A6B|nr:DUF1176 domain-containing protein [Pantoea sp. 1.19]